MPHRPVSGSARGCCPGALILTAALMHALFWAAASLVLAEAASLPLIVSLGLIP